MLRNIAVLIMCYIFKGQLLKSTVLLIFAFYIPQTHTHTHTQPHTHIHTHTKASHQMGSCCCRSQEIANGDRTTVIP